MNTEIEDKMYAALGEGDFVERPFDEVKSFIDTHFIAKCRLCETNICSAHQIPEEIQHLYIPKKDLIEIQTLLNTHECGNHRLVHEAIDLALNKK